LTSDVFAASPEPSQVLVLFGATGDLAGRMLFPSLAALERDKLLSPALRILAVSRGGDSTEAFRQGLREKVQHPSGLSGDALERLLARIEHLSVDANKPQTFQELAAAIGETPHRLFYLSTSPSLYGPITAALKAANLVTPQSRVVMEKPIGKEPRGQRRV
jgi:glucose-6-phosphate 1-dehydrogenase